MARYQVILGYDGTAFSGMQRQAEARTVQGAFEAALKNIGWQGSSVLAAGRTDTGVHATGQVVAFDLDWGHSSQDLCNALNANLPLDIGVRNAQPVAPDFHPRFDATSRTYKYQLICEPNRDPIQERFAWRVWPAPALDQLEAAAESLLGEHDFSAFGTPPQEGGTTIRQVLESFWQQSEASFVYQVTANAFLYHMVRRMVHIQVEIGVGKVKPEDLEGFLSGPHDEMIQGLAPAQGLFLHKITYPAEHQS